MQRELGLERDRDQQHAECISDKPSKVLVKTRKAIEPIVANF
jgi:hypothetical protein